MFKELLQPECIAVIGASQTPGKVGHEILQNLLHSGFAGQLVPVNPRADEILGIKCFHDLKDFKGKVDLSIIAVPPSFVPEMVDKSASAGAKAVVVITAGFREVGEKGLAIEKEVIRKCESAGVRLMGPNCVGLINTHHSMNATFAPFMPRKGRISVISQSGALCVAILDWAVHRDIGLNKVISFGNKADLNEIDFLRELAEDEDTTVIAGYLESITDGNTFLKVAEETASKKPVVILKVGVTAAGAEAASSHTGSLAGADIAYGAAFKRSGIVRAENFEALFDYALAFANQPLPEGRRVAVVTNAGGPGIMSADAAEIQGLDMVGLTDDSVAALKKVLPPTAAFGNPVDVIGDANPQRYADAFEIVQKDPNVDAIVVLLTPQNMTKPLEVAECLAAVHQGEKPILTAFLGGGEVEAARRRLTELGIPTYPSPERAMGALKAMCDYAAWRKRPPRIVTRFPVNRRRVDRIIGRHTRVGTLRIGEVEGKEILRAYDFIVPEGYLVTSAEDAVEAAGRIGFPVVMKIVSPDIVHKSDVGGVRVNLADAEQVRDAYDLMMLRLQRRAPEAYLRGVYVEKMGTRGREVILGMTRDPQFGPMLMFGLGGIFVEVMKDVTFYLAPITSEEAMQMLMNTRSYELLKGARGQAPVDLQAIAGGLQRISQLATDYPQIAELDINPFIVGAVGVDAYVADARMTLALKAVK
ncbi:MAG: acetate--CoA ligase family protein [Verrucomicrobia bacterium]|nr:acetate--CoA ligase family protein [Verrucomicrobiota bacterium]